MPQFEYKARNAIGELVYGTQEATDANALANALIASQITPIEINDKSKLSSGDIQLKWFEEKITPLDIMMFSRQMYTLLKAGIPIMRALTGIQTSVGNPKLAKVVGDLRASLDAGRELSVALADHPELFNGFYVSMIRAGETTGNLDNVFYAFIITLSLNALWGGQIKSALRYPTFVMIAMAAAIIVINVMVIPQFEKVFASLHVELPILTRVLIAFSNFMRDYWFLIILMMFGVWYGFKSYVGSSKGRVKWDALKMKLPIAGKIIFKGTMAKLARSFSLATKSGLPILSGLKLVSQTVDNEYISSKVIGMIAAIERGETILRAANQAAIFNPLVLQMIAVGEESGTLDDLMQEIADMYEADVEYDVKTLGTAIEPIMIIFLGVLVLILALGVFVPIWDMSSHMLNQK